MPMMMLEVTTLFLAALAMALSLAHALEYPGKMRLDRETYIATQSIYYPGFTIGGFGEPVAVLAAFIIALSARPDSAAFWWSLTAVVCLAAMHAIFWIFTQPVNRRWVASVPMSGAAQHFFRAKPQETSRRAAEGWREWEKLRRTWEYSHIARALLAVLGFLSLLVAFVVRNSAY